MKNTTIWRTGLYTFGLLILALGIILNTKSQLGVSPIISVPYSFSAVFGLNFGNASLVMYCILAAIEYLLEWERFKLYDLLQIPLSIVFTRFFNLFGALLPEATNVPEKAACLIAGIILTGIGAAMSMNARLVPNPGDGIVQAISDRVKKPTGFCKNCLDVGCVCTTLLVGFLFAGHPVGVGIGTIAAMIGVGRVIALYNHLFLEKTKLQMGIMEG
ncbi:MAG: DUF6198 family protein [Eubacteriales bacterium]|nr:DUF6198 family protein [Eubacteriales bacterium]